MKDQQVFKIIWDDAGGFGGADETWTKLENIVDSYRNANFIMISVGYLIYEDEDSLIIAQSFDAEYGQYANPLRIPKGMVQKKIPMKPMQDI